MQMATSLLTLYQLTFGMQIVYVTLLSCVKGSMLFFFIRVFPTRFMQLSSKISLAFVAAWTISYLCACIFICNPVEAQWTGLGVCGEYIHMIQSLIATNAFGDLVIMALPMHSIWTLQTRKSEKIGITSCFLLGLAYDHLLPLAQRVYANCFLKLCCLRHIPVNLHLHCRPCRQRHGHHAHHRLPLHARTEPRRPLRQYSDASTILREI